MTIQLAEVQDSHTGHFEPLPDDVIQVESGVRVSFEPTKDIATQADRFLPVAWVWRAGAATPAAACEMVQDEALGDTARTVKHTHAAMDSR